MYLWNRLEPSNTGRKLQLHLRYLVKIWIAILGYDNPNAVNTLWYGTPCHGEGFAFAFGKPNRINL